MKKWCSLLLALVMILGIMNAGAYAETTVGPFGHYDQTVTVNVGIRKSTDLEKDGITPGGNLYDEYLLERSNVVVKPVWEVDDANYDTKISLCIASGDLPDVFEVRDEKQLQMLVENDMIEDLTGTYETKAADYIKDFYESYGDEAFTSATFDGKLMAIPDLNYGYQFDFCWVRKDWLDKLGLELPTTVEDCVNIAQAFIDHDMSGNHDMIGFALRYPVGGIYSDGISMNPILNAFDAYIRSWVVNDDGSIEYGTVQPQAKEGLAYLADLYAKGLIDKEFAVQDWDDVTEILLNNRCGILFASWCLPDSPLSNMVVVNPDSNFVPVLAPLSEDGKFHPMTQQLHKRWLCVRKGYEHPEVAWELINYNWQRGEDERIDEIDRYYQEQLGMDVQVRAPWRQPTVMVQWNDAVPREGNIVKTAIENGYDTTGLSAEMSKFVDGAKKFLEDGDPTCWKYWGARVLGCTVAADESKVETKPMVYPVMSDTMALKWANMQTLENEMILKTIMGEQSIDEFDNFVAQWYAMGGTEITEEVNAQYGKK